MVENIVPLLFIMNHFSMNFVDLHAIVWLGQSSRLLA